MSKYDEIRQARIEKYRSRIDSFKKQSDERFNKAMKMASVIPPGQPMLVDHYSYNRDKNYRNRIDNNMRKSIELEKKSEEYRAKLFAAESNNSISSKDPEAVEKLKEKLENLTEEKEGIKKANKVVKKLYKENDEITKELLEKEGISGDLASKVLHEIAFSHKFYPNIKKPVPFQSFKLSNLNQNIKQVRDRIVKLEETKDFVEDKEDIEIPGYFNVVYNKEMLGIELHFNSKPSEEVRTYIKSKGFRWSRYQGMWYAKIMSDKVLNVIISDIKSIMENE